MPRHVVGMLGWGPYAKGSTGTASVQRASTLPELRLTEY
jgi:hypothetical protein